MPKKYMYQNLKMIYGLNNHSIKKYIGVLGFKPNSLGKSMINRLIINHIKEINSILRIEFKLRLIILSRIMLLIYNKSYRGMRHIQGLPSRGQRTHANGKSPKKLKLLGKNLPFKFKRKFALEHLQKTTKKYSKQKKKIKLSKKQKGKLKAKQKLLKKKKKK